MPSPIRDDTQRDRLTGAYLCEVCYDAMTDQELAAADSPTGLAMAVCEACQGQRQVERWVCGGDWDEAQRFLRDKHLEGTLRQWEPRIILNATSLQGLDKPTVYLIGTYEERADWPAIAEALVACQARVYPG